MGLRNSGRPTYIAAAVVFLVTVYWIATSSTLPLASRLSYPVGAADTVYGSHQQGGYAGSATPDRVPDLAGGDDLGREDEPADRPSDGPAGLVQPAQFPRLIWQASNEEGRIEWASKAGSWKSVDGFQYHFLDDDDATDFVYSHFKETSSAIVAFWDSLAIPVLKSNFLRYLLLLAEGGVYADMDTEVLRHPDAWIPSQFGTHEISAVIGIEYDDDTDSTFIRPVSFSQYTLMAKPGHPIFELAVQRVMSNLDFLARHNRQTLSTLTLEAIDVMEATGSGMISDVVLQVIRNQGYEISWEAFQEQQEPKLFGDILVLPVNKFANPQEHQNLELSENSEILVAHHLGKNWYKEIHDSIGPDGVVTASTHTQEEVEKPEKAEEDLSQDGVVKAVKSDGVKAKPVEDAPVGDDLVREAVVEDDAAINEDEE